MSTLRNTLSALAGKQLLRVDLFDGGVGTMWRPLENLEHATLCKQFGLDPCRVYFDLPSSARGVGSAQLGAGGARHGRKINGYVKVRGVEEPIGTITFVTEGDRLRDVDPMDRREQFRLD